MSSSSNTLIIIIGLVVAMAILAGGAYLVVNKAEDARAELPVLGQVPPFEMTESYGEPFGLENTRGKICVYDFMFTRCHGPCPIMVVNMADLYRAFESTDYVQFISITVDPDHDTLSVLRKYGEEHGVNDGRWMFLHAPIEEVVDLCENGFKLPADDLPGAHTTRFVLVDHLGRIRGYYSGTDDASMRILKDHISRLVQEIS